MSHKAGETRGPRSCDRETARYPGRMAEPRAVRAADHGSHAGHSHATLNPNADKGPLTVALGLIVCFMAAEVVVGILAHSLALLSDAAHMLTDAGALLLSLIVIRLVQKPATRNLTYGFKRAEIFSAQANGVTLLVLALLIIYEGVHRLISPPKPVGLAILIVALAGIVVNLTATWALSKANRESMNIEGSFKHILTDLAAFIFTAIAAGVILATGFRRADGIAALAVAAIMLWAAYGLLRDSGRVFLEAAPEGMSVEEVGRALADHPHVASLHDLHVWEIGSGFPSLSAHLLVHQGDDCHAIRRELEKMLEERFHIQHTTLQVDHEAASDKLTIAASGALSRDAAR
jgi:cobalt-zinc-cadmium efflux system protein